MKITIEKNIYC